jgi:hypothetical protein
LRDIFDTDNEPRRLTPAEDEALFLRRDAALTLLRREPGVDRYALLEAVVWPTPEAKAALLDYLAVRELEVAA